MTQKSRNFERDQEDEGNLDEDAINEIDQLCYRINSPQLANPQTNLANPTLSAQEMRQLVAERERKNLVNDSPLLRAMFEILPRSPVDFRVILSVYEARVAVFSSHVPVMRTNVTAPTQIVINKECMMSSFQLGPLQSYFMSEPEMLFAFVKTLNSHLESVFNTQMLRKERNLQKLRSLIRAAQKAEFHSKKASLAAPSYKNLFNNLAEDSLTES